MTDSSELVKRLPNDIGGLPADPIKRIDKELEPWELPRAGRRPRLPKDHQYGREALGGRGPGNGIDRKADLLRALDRRLLQHPFPKRHSYTSAGRAEDERG
jgi:hypothetical protein